MNDTYLPRKQEKGERDTSHMHLKVSKSYISITVLSKTQN